MTSTQLHTRGGTYRIATYPSNLSAVLLAAFALSATHTTYGWITGIGDPSFTVTTPVAWAFYALGFGAAVVARRPERWLQWALVAYLGVLTAVALFWYPTTFVPRQQTVFGWFENDVYTALLILAVYLGVQNLRGVTMTADRDQ